RCSRTAAALSPPSGAASARARAIWRRRSALSVRSSRSANSRRRPLREVPRLLAWSSSRASNSSGRLTMTLALLRRRPPLLLACRVRVASLVDDELPEAAGRAGRAEVLEVEGEDRSSHRLRDRHHAPVHEP